MKNKNILKNSLTILSIGMMGASFFNVTMPVRAGFGTESKHRQEMKPQKNFTLETKKASKKLKKNSDRIAKLRKVIGNLKKNEAFVELMNMEAFEPTGSLMLLKEAINAQSVDNDYLGVAADIMEECEIDLNCSANVICNALTDALENQVAESISSEEVVPMSQEHSREVSPVRGNEEKSLVCGLTNLGNSCYMNAALQQLYANEALRNEIVSKNWAFEYAPTLYSLKMLFSEMENNTIISADTMDYFNQLIGNLYKRAQEDSVECYETILEKCCEESGTFNIRRMNFAAKHVVESGLVSINGLVNNKEDLGFKDGIAGQYNSLTIGLDRNNGSEKVFSPIVIDKYITINEGLDAGNYKLNTVTVQLGNSVYSGHYVTFRYNANNDTWTIINDSRVTENLKGNDAVNFGWTLDTVENVINQNATMVTYEKIN